MMQESDEQIKDGTQQIEDSAQPSTDDAVVEVEDIEEEIEIEPTNNTPKPTAKSADELVDEARDMVEHSDAKVKDCLEILNEDIAAFEEEKTRVLRGSAHKTEALLAEVGFRADDIEGMAEEGLSFGNEESAASMEVEPLSSGKFSAFVLALVVGALAVAVWMFVAMKSLAIDLGSALDAQSIDRVLLWIGGGITGGEGSSVAGIAILVITALIAMWVAYTSKVLIRENSNKKLAQKVHEEAKFYCTKKEECQKEMLRVSEHINKTISSLQTYDILFRELNSKIKRALHFEGNLSFGAYHPKTKEDMKRAHMLISGIKELIDVPMASDIGLLSNEAVEALEKSDYSTELYKEKLYE